jgi:phage shock protein A
MQGLGDNSAFETFDRMSDQINLLEAEAEAGAELAGELSGDSLESKFLALESGGLGSEEDALNELKAKMGLLSAGSGGADAKRLEAGDAPTEEEPAKGASLSEEDLKELEDLDLSGVDMEELKNELNKMEEELEGESEAK